MSQKPTVVIVMGVSGCGKTTVGEALAKALDWQFEDADDFHPSSNKAKMKAGIPLEDSDREPWLNLLMTQIDRWLASNQSAVLACSALKESYRKNLTTQAQVYFIYLKADRPVLEARLKERSHEYMNPDLLDSQLSTLEEPNSAIVQDASIPVGDIVESLKKKLTKLMQSKKPPVV